jgi:F-type H+-transporting ATPase subunit epsilon
MSDPTPSTFRLKVVTPRRLLCEVDAESASIPTLEGYIGILPGHRPLFAAVGKGVLTYRAEGSEDGHRIEGGFVQVRPDEVVVMTEVSEDESEGPIEGQG